MQTKFDREGFITFSLGGSKQLYFVERSVIPHSVETAGKIFSIFLLNLIFYICEHIRHGKPIAPDKPWGTEVSAGHGSL